MTYCLLHPWKDLMSRATDNALVVLGTCWHTCLSRSAVPGIQWAGEEDEDVRGHIHSLHSQHIQGEEVRLI
jgi:hypothetical protein